METNTEVVSEVKKLFPTRAAYLAMKAAWANGSMTTWTENLVLYNLLRGHNPKRGFTPVKNKTKLANGMNADGAFNTAKSSLKWQVTCAQKTPEALKKYLASWPSVTPEILTEAMKNL